MSIEKRVNNLKIVLDCDEVIGRFMENFLDIWNEKHGTNFIEDNITEYSMSNCLGVSGKEIHDEIIKQQINHQYMNMNTIAGAKYYMTKLHNGDNNLYIVTGREAALDTVLWLRKNMIPFDDLFLTRAKTPIIKALGADVFIDDHIDNIVDAELAGINCIIMDKPYNRDYIGTPRAYNWSQLYKMLGELK